MVRKHIIFYGRVQGVGFRYYSVHKAQSLGLTGWVQNLPDGTVEMEVQGKEEDIDRLIQYMDGRQWVLIEKMDVKGLPLLQERDFCERW